MDVLLFFGPDGESGREREIRLAKARAAAGGLRPRRWSGHAVRPGWRVLPGPLPVDDHRGRQGREYVLCADFPGETESLEVIEEVLLHPGEGEDGAAAAEFGADGLDGFQRGEVDLDVGFGVQDEPAGLPGAVAGGGEGAAAEVLGVGEEQRRVVAVDDQARAAVPSAGHNVPRSREDCLLQATARTRP